MDFTDAEFAVLDLITEDAYALGELVYLGGDVPRSRETVAVLLSMLERGQLSLYLRDATARDALTEGSAEAVLHQLDQAQPQSEGWYRYEAYATDAGQEAYRVAYAERH